MSERIQKLLATAGLASRRAIEEWIALGRITVNGRPAEVGQKVAHDDHVRVDGRLIALARKPVAPRVLLFRKKTGELVTRDDPEGRRTVFRKLPVLESGRWIAVGRLDINTSGLLLMTNDGELARRLTHPSFEIKRIYAVRVLGELTDEIRKRLLSGVPLDDGPAHCEALVNVEPPELIDDGEVMMGGANRWYEVTMGEGRNRIVRRLFEAENLQVSRLIRIAYGPVALGRGIKAGSYREATVEELSALLQAVGMASAPVAGRAPKRSVPRRPRGEIEHEVEEDRQAATGKSGKGRPARGGGSAAPARASGRSSEAPRARAPARERSAATEGARKPSTRSTRPPSPGRSKPYPGKASRSEAAARGRTEFKPSAEAAPRQARADASGKAHERAGERATRSNAKPGTRKPQPSRNARPARPAARTSSAKDDRFGERKTGDSHSAKPGSRSASRPGSKAGAKPGTKPRTRSGARPGFKSGPKSGSKPRSKSGRSGRPPKKPGR